MHANTAISQPVALSVDTIVTALEHDSEFFIEYFMGEELTEAVPKFHVDVFDDFRDKAVRRMAEAVPRDHAKTTLAKLACPFHWLFVDEVEFIVYLSNTSTLAIEACRDVMRFMESDNFIAAFGGINYEVQRVGEGFYIFTIARTGKRCILRAQGMGKQVRGLNIGHQRPQLAIVDDLEDEETAGDETQFLKCKRWLYAAFIKALDKKWNKIIHIGNIHGVRSILDLHCKSPFWYSRRFGCLLSDGTPLWPEMWPIEKLQADYQEYCSMGLADVWFAEMMNLPLAGGRALIKAQDIHYLPAMVPGEQEYAFLSVDLASSRREWAHKTVVAVHAWNAEFNKWQIVEIDHWVGIDPVQLFHSLVAYSEEWNAWVCGIENYAFQDALRPIFDHLAAIYYPDYPLQFVGINHGRQNKNIHISGWAAMLKDRPTQPASYGLTEGDWIITKQLLTYDMQAKDNDDDVIDACAYGPTMTARHMALIMSTIREGKPAQEKARGALQVCGV